MTLSDYLLSEIEQVAEKPTMNEWLEMVSRDEPVELDEPPETYRSAGCGTLMIPATSASLTP